MTRPTRDQMFMQMAYTLALRGTCERAQVGALIVIDGRPAGGGYNGAPSGQKQCIDPGVGCQLLGGAEQGCQRAIHAEANSIAWAARHGVRTHGAVMYSTHSPCKNCAHLIVASEIAEFVYAQPYRLERLDLLRDAGILVRRFLG